VESGLGFTKLMTQHQLNFLLTATTTCLSVYCQTVTMHHVLNHLLPDKTNHEHNLRDCRHNRPLCVKADEKNFLIRQLFKNSY